MLRFAASHRVRRVLPAVGHLWSTRRLLVDAAWTANYMASGGTNNGQPTVGIIVIGDEILKGQTQDTNSYFLVRRLFTLGARVRKISVIPDDLDMIAKEVYKLSLYIVKIYVCG